MELHLAWVKLSATQSLASNHSCMQLLVSKWPAFTSFQRKAVLQSSIGFECAQGSLMPHHRRGGLSPFKPRLARGTFGQLHCRNKPVRDANWQARRAERLACPHLEESSPAKGPSSRRIVQITLALPKSRAAPSLPMAFAVGGLLLDRSGLENVAT